MERIRWVFVGEMRLLGECRGRRKRKSMNGRGRVVHKMGGITLFVPFLCCLLYFALQVYASHSWSRQLSPTKQVGFYGLPLFL